MKPPSGNRISQGQHGPYKAVDYSASPDPDWYAPADCRVTAWGDSGTCGLRLEFIVQGRYRFAGCHNESKYVNVGQNVKKGERMAKMGYTGYTQPDNTPAGTHLHLVCYDLQTKQYLYPPNLINEPFIGGDMSKVGEVEFNNLYRAFFGPMEMNPPSTADRQRWIGAETNAVIRQMEADPRYNAYTQYVKDLEKATGTVPEFLPYAGQQLYIKKEG